MSIEIIDNIKGEWREVTEQKQIFIGQRVRYTTTSDERFGYDDSYGAETRYMSEGGRTSGYSKLFEDGQKRKQFKSIQAFYPLSEETEKKSIVIGTWEKTHTKNRKVAKITIGSDFDFYGEQIFHFIVSMNGRKFMVNCKFGGKGYSSRSTALRGAKRFCKEIGYEIELVK